METWAWFTVEIDTGDGFWNRHELSMVFDSMEQARGGIKLFHTRHQSPDWKYRIVKNVAMVVQEVE